INEELESSDRPFRIVKIAGGYQFATTPQHGQLVQRLIKARNRKRLTQAALETLAIIAYRQPVTRGDIEEIRGVAVSSAILKTLETRGWIEIVGHRNVPGRPQLYATTPNFLNDLNLQSLDQLPPLDELINQTEHTITGE
ncbi:MAG TPA: SMC-Scp complex subunit ScpB, partial [Nitrosomonas sp.]|nr:SMC-Scp complex subunit ScpB [Nitrosomonas sp.]